MLSAAEIEEIEAERALYPDPQAVSIEALKIVQHHRGWVSDETLAEVAEYLGVSCADLEAVATFYNLIYRRPVGRNVIHYCESVSCFLMGCEGLRERLQERLGVRPGETTADGRFTLLPICCLGTCDRAPAMLVNQDLHRDLEDPGQVDAILEQYK